MKRQELADERPETRGAVVGRWFLPEWWAGTAPPPGSPGRGAERLAKFTAAVAAVVLVLLVLAALGGG
ncbi:MAG TPA: hypothetical protein VF114_03895 [Candidatus Limnocylindria bacterium]